MQANYFQFGQEREKWDGTEAIPPCQAVTARFAKTTPLASGPKAVIQKTAIATVTTTIANAWA